ncbi:MAG: PAS domain-containing protein [Actinomycetes bacterium]
MVWVSPAVHRVLGYQPQELVGTLTVKLVHPEDLPVLSSMATRVAAGREGVHWQVRMRTHQRSGHQRRLSRLRPARTGGRRDAGGGCVPGRSDRHRCHWRVRPGGESEARPRRRRCRWSPAAVGAAAVCQWCVTEFDCRP